MQRVIGGFSLTAHRLIYPAHPQISAVELLQEWWAQVHQSEKKFVKQNTLKQVAGVHHIFPPSLAEHTQSFCSIYWFRKWNADSDGQFEAFISLRMVKFVDCKVIR